MSRASIWRAPLNETHFPAAPLTRNIFDALPPTPSAQIVGRARRRIHSIYSRGLSGHTARVYGRGSARQFRFDNLRSEASLWTLRYTGKLTRTSCCGNWICNDADKYVLFSYARNSCFTNHAKYTICAFHHNEGHTGRWQDCAQCRASMPLEMYVHCATNEYNFEKLADPPQFKPTHCDHCGVVIKLATDGYSIGPRGTLCERCSAEVPGAPRPPTPKRAAPPRRRTVALPANDNPNAIEIILSAQTQKALAHQARRPRQ